MIRLEITDPETGLIYVPHLPADLSFEMLRENPLFDRRGDYTYDIDISLRDPHNRAIYQHIDRLTSISKPKLRTARLIADGRVICDGTEVILKKDGDLLKVQIVAGNSEMNYLTAAENLYIREMDFGSIPTPTIETVQLVMDKCYPDANYAFPTIYKGSDTEFDEDSQLNPTTFDNDYYYRLGEMHYSSGSELWPQPYLLYYIEKFIELLGYKIRRNSLRNIERWKRLMLISGYKTLNYAKMLPNWTAAEFLEEIEKFFNVIIVVDQITKDADIINLTEWYKETTPIKIDDKDVLDEFETEYDSTEGKFHNNYSNIEYKLPGGTYWKYANLSEDIMRHCEHLTMTPHDASQLGDVAWKVFYNEERDYYFIRVRTENLRTTKIVNQFAPYISQEGGSTTTFRIIPAEIYFREVTAYVISKDKVVWDYYTAAMPQFYENKTEGEVTFYDAIENGIEDVSGDVIQVSFYCGMIGNDQYKRAYQITTPTNYELGEVEITDHDVPDANTLTLEPRKRFLIDFSNSFRVGEDGYTIRFRGPSMLDPMRQYLIHGRLFVCQQLKYTYANGQQHPIVEGVFYPYI